MNQPIDRKIVIDEIFKQFPNKSAKLTAELSQAGLKCYGCGSSRMEPLEKALLQVGKNDEEINDLIDRLNTLIREDDQPLTISMTKEAANQFKTILAEENKTGWALRFGIQSSGCCGHEYFLDYSSEPQVTDNIFESHGVQIHVDKISTPQLLGATIDFAEGDQGGGFKILHASPGCNCCSKGCCS